MQVHETGGEHLGMHSVVAAAALGEDPRDRVWNAADAGLQRRAFRDQRRGVCSDRPQRSAGLIP